MESGLANAADALSVRCGGWPQFSRLGDHRGFGLDRDQRWDADLRWLHHGDHPDAQGNAGRSGRGGVKTSAALLALGTKSGYLGGGWYDGKSHNLLIWGSDEDKMYLQRVGPALERLDANTPGFGTTVVEQYVGGSCVVGASAGNGKSLIAYQQRVAERYGDGILARLVTNDGLAAPIPSGTGGQSNSGASGIGGSPSSSGGAGVAGNGGTGVAGNGGAVTGGMSAADIGGSGPGRASGSLSGNGTAGRVAQAGGAGQTAAPQNAGAAGLSALNSSGNSSDGCGCSLVGVKDHRAFAFAPFWALVLLRIRRRERVSLAAAGQARQLSLQADDSLPDERRRQHGLCRDSVVGATTP